MKPLIKSEIDSFLKRFDDFKGAEFTNIDINSPSNITFTFSLQDSSREYNWITLKIEFDAVVDASLVENSKLTYIDMDDGISISHNGMLFAFKINNSTFNINSTYIKYEEGLF